MSGCVEKERRLAVGLFFEGEKERVEEEEGLKVFLVMVGRGPSSWE